MIINLLPFQRKAIEKLRHFCAAAHQEYRQSRQNQVISFTAPTGAGKTIIMASLIEDIYCGTEQYIEQPEAIFVWLSDSPELNRQSKDKIDNKADRINLNQCFMVSEDNFDRETLEDGHIYFLNTQKLSRTSKLTQLSEARRYTIWETLANTIAEKSDHLYFIIDEAHRGMKGREAGRATTIMQKFIFGSESDGLQPVPVVIGMSATIERFNALVKNSSATNRPVHILPKEVKDSGLLKDRVIIYYPKDSTEQKDIAILQAATDEWIDKCRHWETYCREQHHAMVKPIFLIQVLNGSNGNLTDTHLDECLATIEGRAKQKFTKGEVVHSFGDTKGKININGLDIPYLEPSKIQDDLQARVVLFKETLSTGWDCPRAETMMSFRRYVDATAIAQLLGRMVRTPIRQRILVDDTLNNVQLFLPHFDADNVQIVVNELQNEEGGELPTDIEGAEWGKSPYVTLSAKHTGLRKLTDVYKQDLFGPFQEPSGETAATNVPQTQEEKNAATSSQHGQTPLGSTKQTTDNVPAIQPALDFGEINRPEIVDFINHLALPNYQIRSFQMNDYLKSMFSLCRFLLLSGLDVNAKEEAVNHIVEQIHNYIESLKLRGKYDSARKKVLNFEMLANIYNAFGERIKAAPVSSLFSETNIDIEREARIAEKKLGGDGVAQAYGRKYDNPPCSDNYMVDLILFVVDEEQMRQLHEFAKKEYHRLINKYRQKTTLLDDALKIDYRNIVRDSGEISEVPFYLGEQILFHNDTKGELYDDHLFVDEKSGNVRINLNGWEKLVIAEERKRPDFRCWYRNPSRGKDALTLYHIYKGTPKAFYPDFLIVRKVDNNYVVDILEPHDPTRDDNVSKAKALAKYAEENCCIGRAQLIRLTKNATGSALCRLDFATHSELWEKVKVITTNEELDNLFTQYSEN